MTRGRGVGRGVRHNTHEISKSRHKIFTDLPVAMKEISRQLLLTHLGFPRSPILPQTTHPAPDPPDWKPELGAGGRSSLIFSNFSLQQDRYLPKTFLKWKPVKICFQNSSASIIDNKH